MQKYWYLRTETQCEGPFSEPEIRARLLANAFTPKAEVKQGDSEWRPAADVKQLFIQIYEVGWYVKANRQTVGPFVTRKILDLHGAGLLPKGTMLRQGYSTYWLDVAEAIAMIQQKLSLLGQIAESQEEIDPNPAS
jgi:GYF domain 2